MNLLWVSRPSVLNVTLKKKERYFFKSFFLLVVGCGILCQQLEWAPLPATTKVLGQHLLQIFQQHLHPSVHSNTLLTPEHSEGLPKLQVTHTLLHLQARIQVDPRGIIEQQASVSKGAPSTLTPQHLPTEFKSTEYIWKDSAKIYFPVQLRPTNSSLSLWWEKNTLGSRQPGTARAERGDIHRFNYYKWVHTLS